MVGHLSANLQPKYLVFENNLLSLFKVCAHCRSSATEVKKTIIGTFLRLRQSCFDCGHHRNWDSQPFLNNIPAGNILLSASILFSGALPSQALRLFQILKCSAITARTYFDHQRFYLQPTVLSVWNRHQSTTIDRLIEQGGKIVAGGDGRADSPGHSAKFGSYTVMDLETRQIVDIQLVQVLYLIIVFRLYKLYVCLVYLVL